MKKRLFPLALSAVVLSSCMPTIQTSQGAVQVGFVTGTPYALVQKTPLSQVTEQTPEGSYVTFPDCQGGAVKLSDLRKYGPELTDQACRAGVQRSVDAQSALVPLQIISIVPVAFATYYIYRLFSCLFGCN